MHLAEGTFDLPERLKHFGDVLGLNADAGIGHRYRDIGSAAENIDCDLTALGGELQRIGKQIEQHLMEALDISRQEIHPVIDMDGYSDLRAGGLGFDEADTVDDDFQDLDPFHAQFQFSRVKL